MPRKSEDSDWLLRANGPAYTQWQERHGVPLSYIGEKLGFAIEELHRFAQQHGAEREALVAPMYYLLVAHLGLHNLLGKANDRSLAGRLLNGSDEDLQAWLRLIAREGDVQGLAGLDGTGSRRQR